MMPNPDRVTKIVLTGLALLSIGTAWANHDGGWATSAPAVVSIRCRLSGLIARVMSDVGTSDIRVALLGKLGKTENKVNMSHLACAGSEVGKSLKGLQKGRKQLARVLRILRGKKAHSLLDAALRSSLEATTYSVGSDMDLLGTQLQCPAVA